MAKSRFSLALLFLLLWTATPALRCMVPADVLSPEEQACCKAMGGQCADSPQSSHPCCKHAESNVQPALATAHASLPQVALVAFPISVISLPSGSRYERAEWLSDPSPPNPRVLASVVLRI